jgi:uncharacterized protein YodC (DUF2158 family)
MKHNIDDATLQAAIDTAFKGTPLHSFTTLFQMEAGMFRHQSSERLALARDLLARLPEPPPPVVDGKTPGQVYQEVLHAIDPDRFYPWIEIRPTLQQEIERAASAVLAAFGGHGHDVSTCEHGHKFRTIASHPAKSESEWECPHCLVIERREARKCAESFRECAEIKFGPMPFPRRFPWESGETVPLRIGQASLEAAIARMEALSTDDLYKAWDEALGDTYDRIEAVRARLIAAARGEGQPPAVDWQAHIRLPADPATIKPSDTFTAHGKLWTRHTPGDPMPCDGSKNVEVMLKFQLVENDLIHPEKIGARWNWGLTSTPTEIIGWRYADAHEPTAPPPAPWTPAVGDVVRLKSGGPLMVVHEDESGGSWDVRWLSPDGYMQSAVMFAACLQPVKEDAQ